jgi:hypothetical protein
MTMYKLAIYVGLCVSAVCLVLYAILEVVQIGINLLSLFSEEEK